MMNWRFFGWMTLLALALALAGPARAVKEGELQALIQMQRFDEAERLLMQALTQNPRDLESRMQLGQLAHYRGESDRAIEVLRGGLTGSAEDAKLWNVIGDMYQLRAEDGPFAVRVAGMVSHQPRPEKKDLAKEMETSYCLEQWTKAAEAFGNVMRANPADLKAAEKLAGALQGSNQTAYAEQWWKYVVERDPTNAFAATQYAAIFYQRQDLAGTRAILSNALKHSPRNAFLHTLWADLAAKEGNVGEAEISRAQATFYRWLPAFCEHVEFSDKNLELMNKLQERPETVDAAVKELMLQNTKESSEILAAVCVYHNASAVVEEACFRTLKDRGEGDLLVQVFTNASNSMVSRRAGAVLAEMKHPSAFEMLVAVLPTDTRPAWHLDAAQSLAILGDPRAVQPLIQAMAPFSYEAMRQNLSGMSEAELQGFLYARQRAALALGYFKDNKEAWDALMKGGSNPDIRDACQAALYRQTGKLMHLKAIVPYGDTRKILMEYIKTINTPEAKQTYERWQAEEAAEAQDAAAAPPVPPAPPAPPN